MRKQIAIIATSLLSFAALAAHHGSAEDEVRAAADAFNTAYATNDIEAYFDLVIQMMPGGETAIATSFIDNRTRSPEGEVSTVRAFETDVWQKIDGEWKIVSLHYSEIAPDG